MRILLLALLAVTPVWAANTPRSLDDCRELPKPQSIEAGEGIASVQGPGTYYPEAEHARLGEILRCRRVVAEELEARVARLEAENHASRLRIRQMELELAGEKFDRSAAEHERDALKIERGHWWLPHLGINASASVAPLAVGEDRGRVDATIGLGFCWPLGRRR